MLKIFGACIIIFSGYSIGNFFVSKLNEKLSFFESFKDFVIYVKNEIKYSLSPPEKIIGNYNSRGEFIKYVNKCNFFLDKGLNFSQSWNETSYIFEDISGDLNEIIRKFGAELGSCNSEGQIAFCKLTEEKINPYIKLTSKELNEKRKVFLTLGACAGAAAAVFLF
ncbi:MAG: stage III sporulation protein AB [Oscillospiraceae bacterium]|nr:stage III sporulation protein AB [Oscillospiraceae bacterium]